MQFIARLIAIPLACITIASGLLVCCRPACAEIVHVGLNADIEISEPVSAGDGSESLLMFHLAARAKNGVLLGAFDGTIGGPLHQQSAGATTTPTLDEPLVGSTFVTDIDSHFLINAAGVISPDLPTETLGAFDSSAEAANATEPGAPLATTSFGTSLSGAFAPVPSFAAVWPLAQIVVARGSTVVLQFDLAIVEDTVFIETVTASFDVGVFGDLTGNDLVDFQDLTILLANWNEMVGSDQGNLVNAGTTVVNFADLTVLLANWTGSAAAGAPQAAAGAQAVPEPSSLLLSVLAGLGLLFSVRRRR